MSLSCQEKQEGGIIRTDSRHFVKNQSTQVNTWHRGKTTFELGESTMHLLQESSPFLGGGSFQHLCWAWAIDNIIFPLCSSVDIWFQCFTALLILFCLSDKHIVVTNYYANCFRLVLKIHCTALF